jgi:hypothetical protein
MERPIQRVLLFILILVVKSGGMRQFVRLRKGRRIIVGWTIGKWGVMT